MSLVEPTTEETLETAAVRLGVQLREARGGRSQTEVAEAVGMSQRHLAHAERGDRRISWVFFEKLCVTLHIVGNARRSADALWKETQRGPQP